MRTAAAAVASAILVTGCTSPGGRAVQGALGAAMFGGGMTLIGASRSDDTPLFPGEEGSPTQGDLDCLTSGACLVGGLLAIVGLTTITLALDPTTNSDQDEPPLLYTSPPDPHPNVDADGMPEVRTDDVTLQLARSARSAIRRGNCGAARSILRKIERRDRSYHFSFVRTDLVAPCR